MRGVSQNPQLFRSAQIVAFRTIARDASFVSAEGRFPIREVTPRPFESPQDSDAISFMSPLLNRQRLEHPVNVLSGN
jgi:hypothetical protein